MSKAYSFFILCSFVFCIATPAKAQFAKEESRKSDSLRMVVEKIENKYRASATEFLSRANRQGGKSTVIGKDERNRVVYYETTGYFKSGAIRRKVRGYSYVKNSRRQTMFLKMTNGNIVYGEFMFIDAKNIKIVNNRFF